MPWELPWTKSSSNLKNTSTRGHWKAGFQVHLPETEANNGPVTDAQCQLHETKGLIKINLYNEKQQRIYFHFSPSVLTLAKGFRDQEVKVRSFRDLQERHRHAAAWTKPVLSRMWPGDKVGYLHMCPWVRIPPTALLPLICLHFLKSGFSWMLNPLASPEESLSQTYLCPKKDLDNLKQNKTKSLSLL